jgi:plastocyanin
MMKTPNLTRMLCGLLTLSIVFLLHAAHADTITVHVGQAGPPFGTTFSPDPVFIAPGDTVEWVWDASGHSVTSGTVPVPDGMFDTGLQSAGFIFSFTFPSAGTFPYFCTRHLAMMTGTVNVVDPSPTPSPTPSTTPNPTATATATVAPSPSTTPNITISGTVSYCSNPAPAPVPSVTLTLTGTGSGSTLSDGAGNYFFPSVVPGGSYIVTPTKAALLPGANGINTVDVIATQRHFLNIGTPLSGCRLTAADVNGDTSVNTVDVIAIQRFFLTLSSGIANTGKYQFAPTSRSYPGISQPQSGQDYDTLVFGDVAAGYVH